MVIFPSSVSSLFVGRDRSMEATRRAMDGNRFIVLVAQRETETILPEKKDLFEIGVLGEVLQLLKMPDGTLKVLIEGIRRVRVQEFFDREDYYEVKISTEASIAPDETEEGQKQQQLLDKVIVEINKSFETFNSSQNVVSQEFLEELTQRESPEYTIDSIAHALPLPFQQKQDIIETSAVLERAEKVQIAIKNQLDILNLESSIQDRVRQQMDKMQRQFYLNEQMKIIRDEMGEGEADEFEEFRQRIKEKKLPEEIQERAETELNKLEKMPAMSAESAVIRNYIDWILDLPWSETSQDNHSIQLAEQVLNDSHHGLEKIKDRILEFIAVRQLVENPRGPILCLVGPPGVGKTSLAKSLADSLHRKFARISLGGVRDEAEIRGHRRTYIGALPGRIISTLKKTGVKNPVILLDEIDKLSSDFRGNPAAALLEVLDPEQNHTFTDHYLELPFDLSQVLFLATANVEHSIPEALLDRLEVINLSGYTEQEKIQIAKKYLIPKQINDSGIAEVNLQYSSKSIAFIIRHYTKEAGVRQLEREMAKIARKIAREYLAATQAADNTANKSTENNVTSTVEIDLKNTDDSGSTATEYILDKKTIRKLLGPVRYNYGRRDKELSIGKVTGLAWTSAGGDLLNIEVALAHGKGSITITGNLGDVMKESANTALGYVKSVGHHLGLPDDFFEKTDVFLHVPEGAIPKDGPSAGITIATSLISALTQVPVKNHVAMTGEITLRGKVLAIGGLKEKVLAAFRGGITDIICPEENEKDLEDIPESIRERLNFHFVENIRQVVGLALKSGNSLFNEKPGTYAFYSSHLSSLHEQIQKLRPDTQ